MKKFFSIILIILFSCNENTSTTTNTAIDSIIIDTAESNSMKVGTDTVSSRKKHLGRMFIHSNPFKIVTFNRGITFEYTGDDDTSACKTWKINKEDLPVIFKNSEPIDGTTWDLAFAFTTCIVEGQLKQNNQLFEYSINAGSWFSVSCRDTFLLFGDFNKRDRKFFLKHVME